MNITDAWCNNNDGGGGNRMKLNIESEAKNNTMQQRELDILATWQRPPRQLWMKQLLTAGGGAVGVILGASLAPLMQIIGGAQP